MIQLLKEGSFWGFDLLANSTNSEIFGDLDLSFNDLGGDHQGMEEVDLWGVEAGWSSWDCEVDWCDDTDSCLSGDSVCFDF